MLIISHYIIVGFLKSFIIVHRLSVLQVASVQGKHYFKNIPIGTLDSYAFESILGSKMLDLKPEESMRKQAAQRLETRLKC